MTTTRSPRTIAPPPTAWDHPFDTLRQKWSTVPAAMAGRVTTTQLLAMSDADLAAWWTRERDSATTGQAYAVRGWYHELYKVLFKGKRVLDVGAGLGLDGLTFAQHGAHMTLLDIVPDNVALHRRLAHALRLPGAGAGVEHFYMKDIGTLDQLRGPFDVIWCQGSLINAPFEVIRAECQALLRHLPIGGRWVELAYPQVRWQREGSLPFEQWGNKTDGQGTPWVEWYDLDKLRAALEPAKFDVVLYFDFYNSDFNWFDLIRRA